MQRVDDQFAHAGQQLMHIHRLGRQYLLAGKCQ